MRLLKCPKCGEMFSDTYKTCPFCQEDEERHSSKPVKSAGHRTGGGRAKPKVGGGVVIVCLVLVLSLAAYTIFGNQITAFFTGEKDAPTPEPAVLTMNKTSVELTVGSSFALTVSGGGQGGLLQQRRGRGHCLRQRYRAGREYWQRCDNGLGGGHHGHLPRGGDGSGGSADGSRYAGYAERFGHLFCI